MYHSNMDTCLMENSVQRYLTLLYLISFRLAKAESEFGRIRTKVFYLRS